MSMRHPFAPGVVEVHRRTRRALWFVLVVMLAATLAAAVHLTSFFN